VHHHALSNHAGANVTVREDSLARFSCFNAYHPDTDNFQSNFTLLLEAGFSTGVKLSILKNAPLSNPVLLQH